MGEELYLIAYLDDGKGFFDSPWVLPEEYGTYESAQRRRRELEQRGLRQVTIFKVDESYIREGMPEEVLWAFALRHEAHEPGE